MPREFDDHGLHAQADAEVGHFPLAREADGLDHALDAALAKPAWHQDPIEGLRRSLAAA